MPAQSHRQFSDESVLGEIQDVEFRERAAETRRQLAGDVVAREIKKPELRRVEKRDGEGAVDGIVGKIESLEPRERAQVGRERAGKLRARKGKNGHVPG